MHMDLNDIRKLIKMVDDSTLREFSIKEGDTKITMSKNTGETDARVIGSMPPLPGLGMAPSSGAATPVPSFTAPVGKTVNNEEENTFILSPIVGTFYSASAPDTPAFVKVGDTVKSGDTVCILEAMKLMTEIEADFDCEIEAVLVSNEQKVEYGQPLFRVKKL